MYLQRLGLIIGLLLTSTHSVGNTVTEVDVIAVEFPPFTGMHEPEYGLSFKKLNVYLHQHYQLRANANFLPPARAQKVVKTDDWCLSFYPPKNKEAFEFIPLSDKKVKLGLYRRAESSPFTWENLSDLSGKSVAILHYRQPGQLQFMLIDAGLKIVPVESNTQGLKMLERGRVDLVFSTEDNPYIDSLPDDKKQFYQFSEKAVLETEMGVFMNPKCKHVFEDARLP